MPSKRVCLFNTVCDPKDYIKDGCPFNLSRESFKKSVIPKNCFTWNAHRRTTKERRLAYAQKARNRREIARSEGQDGHVAVREGHSGFESEAQTEIAGNVG